MQDLMVACQELNAIDLHAARQGGLCLGSSVPPTSAPAGAMAGIAVPCDATPAIAEPCDAAPAIAEPCDATSAIAGPLQLVEQTLAMPGSSAVDHSQAEEIDALKWACGTRDECLARSVASALPRGVLCEQIALYRNRDMTAIAVADAPHKLHVDGKKLISKGAVVREFHNFLVRNNIDLTAPRLLINTIKRFVQQYCENEFNDEKGWC